MKAGTVKPWLGLSERDVCASPGTQRHWALNHRGQQVMEGALTPPRLLSGSLSSVRMWFGVSPIQLCFFFNLCISVVL